MDTDRGTEASPQSPTRRVTRIARVGVRYGFGFVFGGRFTFRRRRADTGRVGPRLRLSFEELGPTFAELGRFLSARGDLLPQEVAAELGRASIFVKPSAPAEVRARVERELGNTLERLFLEFDEVPTRTGTFTQSHRVVLPGERPALMVIPRPGVRRDLLAMRPVAELTRRRLGERLPLDPVQVAAEFSTHVAHRRDMYSAAQNLHRLRNLDALGVRVPEMYRDYSTDRCITFETPAVASLEPFTNEQYRRTSSSLIRMALVEGLFLPDTVPERFALSGGELWLADPTEIFALDDERLRGIAEVLAAVRREDVEGVVRALPLAGSNVPQNTIDLRRELRETMGSLGGPLWREHRLSDVRESTME
ncbi:MAG: AarF/UbiB family protein, partial [Rubrobacteraceae bacterium]